MTIGKVLPKLGNSPRRLVAIGLFVLLAVPARTASAHVGNHPSVHDTVANVMQRMREQLNPEDLQKWTALDAENFLTASERHILGTEHITFEVDVPVVVSIIRDRDLKSEPFWLRENFRLTGLVFQSNGVEMDVWEKEFPAGGIGLGINSLSGGEAHYLVLVRPGDPDDTPTITHLYPGNLRIARFQPGVAPYVDQTETLDSIPKSLVGQRLIRTKYASRNDAKLLDLFRWTDYPAGPAPDQIVLTWSEDPRTTQTIQWRTSTNITRGIIAYQPKATFHRFHRAGWEEKSADISRMETPNLLNDPVVHRHTVVLRDLQPGTTYVYSVGDGSETGWSELAEFTTAPVRTRPFSFIYMGDAQNGLDRWGTLVRNAFRERPDAAFYLMAGDLVNRGNERDDWDKFFENAAPVYDRRQLVPAIGNHENQGGHPTLYLKQFTLPENGPEELEKERLYAFEYSNALFVILDSNLDPRDQTQWLEKTLAGSRAKWKFVAYHHPAYSSAPGRDNHQIRDSWIPLFDKYHVDLALQGHDHAYLRTYPMHNNQRVDRPDQGTIYIVSVSGTKMYSQAEREYTEVGMTNTSTYQVLDIQISGDRMVYRAYDIDGNLRDQFTIEK